MPRQYFPYFTDDPTGGGIPKPGFGAMASAALGADGSTSDGYDAASAAVGGSMAGLGALLKKLDACFAQLNTSVAAGNSIPIQNLDSAIDLATKQLPPMLDRIDKMCLGIGCDPAAIAALPAPPAAPPVTVGPVGCPGASSGGGGLGGITTDAQITTAAESALGGLALTGVVSGPLLTGLSIAIPVIGAAVAIALVIVNFVGKGCGEPCIDASQAEQIYESAADNIAAVYRHGMLTLQQAVAFLVYILGAGQQHMAGFGTPQAARGSSNMTTVIQNLITAIQKEPAPKPVPLGVGATEVWYAGGPGWYPNATQQGAILTKTLLNELPNLKGV